MIKGIGAALAAAVVAFTMGAASPSDAGTTPSLSQAILATSPAFYYPLTDAPGSTTAADQSGNDGPAMTMAEVNAYGATGTGLAFTGTAARLGGTEYLTGGPAPASADFSVGTWFSADDACCARTLLTVQGWVLRVYGGGDQHPAAVGFLDRTPSCPAGACTIPSVLAQRNLGNGDHQLVASDHAGTVTLYLDGTVVGSTAGVQAVRPAALSIGSIPGEAGFNAFHGAEHDVAGWTRALSAGEVATLYAAGPSPAVTIKAQLKPHRLTCHRTGHHRPLCIRLGR